MGALQARRSRNANCRSVLYSSNTATPCSANSLAVSNRRTHADCHYVLEIPSHWARCSGRCLRRESLGVSQALYRRGSADELYTPHPYPLCRTISEAPNGVPKVRPARHRAVVHRQNPRFWQSRSGGHRQRTSAQLPKVSFLVAAAHKPARARQLVCHAAPEYRCERDSPQAVANTAVQLGSQPHLVSEGLRCAVSRHAVLERKLRSYSTRPSSERPRRFAGNLNSHHSARILFCKWRLLRKHQRRTPGPEEPPCPRVEGVGLRRP